MERLKAVMLFGAPGTGKGTQGKMIGGLPGFFHHSSGDVFRNLDPQSEIGKTFFHYSTRGELVPDDVTITVWHENIKAQQVVGAYRPNRDLLVLDGIPRNAAQAAIMDKHCEVLGLVHLTCDDPTPIFERLRQRALKENRPDDAKDEVIRRRWEVYEGETKPVLGHYDASLAHKIDAIGAPVEVLARVLAVVAPLHAGNLG